jgi:hypothetical protein
MVFGFACEYHHKRMYIVGQRMISKTIWKKTIFKEDQRTTLLAKFGKLTTLLAKFGKLCPVFPDEMSKVDKFIDNIHQKMVQISITEM